MSTQQKSYNWLRFKFRSPGEQEISNGYAACSSVRASRAIERHAYRFQQSIRCKYFEHTKLLHIHASRT